MQYALDLASRGKGKTLTNPMVGCIIVHKDKIIGEGWHQKHGGPHAEPNAVNAVSDKSLISESDMYVTLEPCAHHGKTPPCADLIATVKPKRLFICNLDPNPLVSGKGLGKIQAAGTEIHTGILEKKGLLLNRRFFTFHNNKRPYIILKWAQTADGFIARNNYDSKWISSLKSRTLVHQWRTEEEAIMVGTNTTLHDNPQLNVRLTKGKKPLRLFIDRTLRIPKDYNIFDKTQATICYNSLKDEQNDNLVYKQIDFTNNIAPQILTDLYNRNVQSVIIEGGSMLLAEFITLGLWDEARIFKSKTTFNEGIPAPIIKSTSFKEESIDTDELITTFNKNM